MFGPSDLTISFLQRVQSALVSRKHEAEEVADADVRLHDDDGKSSLEFPVDIMTRELDAFFVEERANILKTMGELPIFTDNFHSIGQTMPEQREITHQQIKDFVKHVPSYQFSDVINNPLKWISHLESTKRRTRQDSSSTHTPGTGRSRSYPLLVLSSHQCFTTTAAPSLRRLESILACLVQP